MKLGIRLHAVLVIFFCCVLLLNANIGYSSIMSPLTNRHDVGEPNDLPESSSEVIELYATWYGFTLEVDNDALAPYLYNYETSIDGDYYPICVGQDLDPILFKRYYRGFAQWDTSAIPDGSDIQSVELTIYLPSTPNPIIGDYVDVYSSDMDIYEMTHKPSDYGRGNPNDNFGGDLFDDAYDGTLYAWQWVDQGDGWVTIDLGSSAAQSLEDQLGTDWFAVGFHEFTENEDGTGEDRGVSFYGGYSKLTISYEPPSNVGDEWFYSVDYIPFDSDGDGFNDALEVKMDVDTTDGTLYVTVYGYLYDPYGNLADSDSVTWQITGSEVEYGYLYLYVPTDSPEGYYDVELYLYDEQGNYEDYRYDYDVAYLYPPEIPEIFFTDVSFTPVDGDGDGYYGSVTVCWRACVDANIYVDVYVEAWGVDSNGNKKDLGSYGPYTIYNCETDYKCLEIVVPYTDYWDIVLELYDWETLTLQDEYWFFDVPMETPSDDQIPFPSAWFYSAWTENSIDNDGDGYYESVDLCWDADTNLDSLYVYVDIWAYDGSWYFIDTYGPYWIYDEEYDVARYTLNGYQLPYTGYWDIVLELYDYYTGQFYNDTWLYNIPMGTYQPTSAWYASVDAIETNGYTDTVIFGERSDASDGQDAYDVPKPPPGPPPSLYMYFVENLTAPYDKLQEDWKFGPDTYKEWILKIFWQDTVSTTITLTWSFTISDFEYTSIMLQDPVTGTTVDMQQQSSYQFTMNPGSRELHIICSYRFFITQLQQGWNLISSPSATTVSLNNLQIYCDGVWYTWDEAVVNGIVMPYVYTWDGTRYVVVNQLEPGKGYWAYAYQPCQLYWQIP